MIYLDYNGTAPFAPSVRDYLAAGAAEDWANPSAEHDLGYSQKIKLQNNRERIADILGCEPKQLIITSGGTESINSVINTQNLVSLGIRQIISSPLEHSATLSCLEAVEPFGIDTIWVNNTPTGGIDYAHFERLCRTHPKSMVSLMIVNNETGVINDVSKVSRIARQHGCLIHLDAVQALGKLTCDLGQFDYDFASISGHKIGSLKGVGALIVKEPKRFRGLIHGGSQEQGKRAGTTNVLGIKSLLLALEDARRWNIAAIEQTRDAIFKTIQSSAPDVMINCEKQPRVCNTLNLFIPGRTAKSVLLNCGGAGVLISTGSACTSGYDRPSYVIESLYGSERAQSSVRISIGPDTVLDNVVPAIKNGLSE